jgi:AraC-like DNA-binding protein
LKHTAANALNKSGIELSCQEDRLVGSARLRADVHESYTNFIARNLFKYEIAKTAANDACLEVDARARSISGFTVARFTTTCGKSRLVRGAPEIGNDARDRYVVYMSLRGDLEFTQLRRTQICSPSSCFTFLSAAEPISHIKLGDNDTLCFLMPRDFVDQRLMCAHNRCARPFEFREGLGHLVHLTLAGFAGDSAKMSTAEFQTACCLMGDLVLLALSGDADVMAGEKSIRAANLARLRAVVRARCSEPELSLCDIANDCRLSLSYVHNLFRDNGSTLGEFLKAERLQRARQLLEFPAGPAVTVTDVSYACGFSSPSRFSTVFRRAFGVSPRDVLRQRLKEKCTRDVESQNARSDWRR